MPCPFLNCPVCVVISQPTLAQHMDCACRTLSEADMEGLGPEQARVENNAPDEEHTTAVMRITPVEHHLLAMPEGEQLPQNNNQVPDNYACCTISRGGCSPMRVAPTTQSAWLTCGKGPLLQL
jgi:hypothetical protein